jgi:WD40 repeat protein
VSTVEALAVLPLPDERVLLAVGGEDGSVGVWDPFTRDMVTDLSSRSRNRVVTALAVLPLPDERVLLAVGGVDGSVQLWDPVATKQVWNLRAGPGISALAAVPLPDQRVLLATGSVDGSVRLWDPVATKQVWNLRAAPGYQHWPRCRCPISGCCSPPAASMDRYDCGTR